jgi:hypothetical protein
MNKLGASPQLEYMIIQFWVNGKFCVDGDIKNG